MTTVSTLPRGCGSRQAGGVYVETLLSNSGLPLIEFVFDPPKLLPKGTIEIEGVTHLIDHVGNQYYPNVADFFEEVRHMGLSRRIPSNFNFEKITESSRILLVHDRAFIRNFAEYKHWNCPKAIEAHSPENVAASKGKSTTMCVGVWWQDLCEGTTENEENPQNPVLRKMPSFTYSGHHRPKDIKPKYEPAIFMGLPISRLVVVKGNHHEQKLAKMKKAKVPSEVVDN